jgi:two-component system, NarL family, nitrate/nitrite response regulator NarL
LSFQLENRLLSDDASGAPTAVFIISDAPLYLRGLVHTLQADGRVAVVGWTGRWDEGLAQMKCLPEPPDAVLVDMTPSAGFDCVQTLAAALPRTPALALVGSDDEAAIARWARAGVSGLVSRRATLDEFVRTIEGVADGQASCSSEVTAALLRRVASHGEDPASPAGDPALTSREREVVQLLEHGLSNKQIANRLEIELATVKNHVHHILGKLNAHRRGEAVAKVREERFDDGATTALLRRGGAAAW